MQQPVAQLARRTISGRKDVCTAFCAAACCHFTPCDAHASFSASRCGLTNWRKAGEFLPAALQRELVVMGRVAEDFVESGPHVEDEHRHRDDQNESCRNHGGARSTCNLDAEYDSTRNFSSRPLVRAGPGLPQSLWGGDAACNSTEVRGTFPIPMQTEKYCPPVAHLQDLGGPSTASAVSLS